MNGMATETGEGQRLDLRVAERAQLSRAAAQTLIGAGLVLVNGRRGRPGQRLRDLDVVEVFDPPVAETVASAGPSVDLRIVAEDAWLAVVDKPAGLVVHPAPGHPTGTLADGLRQRGDTWSRAGGAERPGIVHRLDRFTSGLLVVAKTEAAHQALSAQLADRSLGRDYWALVRGVLREDTGEIDAPIGRDPGNRQRMRVLDAGRPAHTDFRVVERCPATTVLDVSLRTGRTHQIRVHLASISRPLVGDSVYGSARESGRPALHARRLRFLHPADNGPREYTSALPDDLVEVLRRARAGESG
ncbi:MAG: RluA family pseudouridine synthase [Candidatus Dormibacteria bacterium]